MSRYNRIGLTKNNNEVYKDFFNERNIKFINHYATLDLRYPTEEEFDKLILERHLWKSEDAYWKLAQKHYNDPSYWWVIAYINKTPVDSQLSPGDIIEIPKPLDRVLNIIKQG
jgi:hypothetical protein